MTGVSFEFVEETTMTTSSLNSSSKNSTDSNRVAELTTIEFVFFASLYGLAILVACIGNATITWIILRSKRMRQSNTNYFIINLAAIDFFIMIFNVPWTFIYSVNGNQWVWGTFLCKSIWSFGTTALSANAFTFAAIMLDRLRAILQPLQKRVERRRHVVASICAIWFLAALSALPTAIWYRQGPSNMSESSPFDKIEDEEGGNRTICGATWSSDIEFIHMIVLGIVQFFIPLVLTVISYCLIRNKLSNSRAIGESRAAEEVALRAKRKVVSMMMAIVLIFVICVLPYNIFVVIMTIPEEYMPEWFLPIYSDGRTILLLFVSLYWVSASNSMWNPFIYCYMNKTFRVGFKYVFRLFPCVPWDPEVDLDVFMASKNPTFMSQRARSAVGSRHYPSSIRGTPHIGSLRASSLVTHPASHLQKTCEGKVVEDDPIDAQQYQPFLGRRKSGNITSPVMETLPEVTEEQGGSSNAGRPTEEEVFVEIPPPPVEVPHAYQRRPTPNPGHVPYRPPPLMVGDLRRNSLAIWADEGADAFELAQRLSTVTTSTSTTDTSSVRQLIATSSQLAATASLSRQSSSVSPTALPVVQAERTTDVAGTTELRTSF